MKQYCMNHWSGRFLRDTDSKIFHYYNDRLICGKELLALSLQPQDREKFPKLSKYRQALRSTILVLE